MLRDERRGLKIVTGLLAALLASVSMHAFAALGDLDTTFNGTGKVTTNVGSNTSVAYGVALQSDGKIVAAGSVGISSSDFAVVRYNTNGALDLSFNTTGKVTTAVGSSADEILCVAVQSDGKILAGGYSRSSSNDNFALVRYNTNGSLDTTFSGDGKVTTDLGTNNDYAYSMVVQSDGKIILAGYTQSDLAMVRYNSDGTLDSGFGSSGIVITNLGGSDRAFGVAVQGDGKIVLAGHSDASGSADFAVVRYLADGTLDTTFNATGIVTTPVGASGDEGLSVALQSDGKIIVAGRSYISSVTDFALVRYNTDGSLDSSFGSGGKLTTPIGSGYDDGRDLLLQSDGKIIVAGTSSNQFAVVRYNGDGTLDTGFGNGGKVTIPVGSGAGEAHGVVMQSNGRIVLAGQAWDGSEYDFAVVRLLGDPSPEISVSGNGSSIADGDLTPSTADHTGFSTAQITGGTVTRTYTIQNSGDGALTVGTVTISGTDAADFTVNAQPSSSVAVGGSTTFQITFDPAAAGTRSATVNFANNDGDETSFDFAIQGVGIGFPSAGQLVRPGNLATSLRGWWKLDEVSGARADSSGNGNAVSDSNGTGSVIDDYWSTNERSADFESSSLQRLSIANASQSGLGITGSHSIAAWIKLESATTGLIAGKNSGQGVGYGLSVTNAGALSLRVEANSYSSANGVIQTGKWHHVSSVFDDSGDRVLLFVDGNLVSVQASTNVLTSNTNEFRIGQLGDGSESVDGLLKDVAVWDRPLMPAEIKSLASGIDVSAAYRPGNVTVAPTAWWKLNEISSRSGTVQRLDSAGSHHLSDAGSLVGSAGGYLDGAAARFAGNPQFLSGPTSSDYAFGTGDFTVTHWIKFATIPAQPAWLGIGRSQVGGAHGITFTLYQNQLYLYYQGSPRTWNWAPQANTWYHITLKRDGESLAAYIDGRSIGTHWSTENITNTDGIFMGRDSVQAAHPFDGTMQDVAIWKGYALSDIEIKALATALPVQRAGIAAYWPLDETSGARSDVIGGLSLNPFNGLAGGTGRMGGAADFERDSLQYLQVSGAPAALNLAAGYSMFAWVNRESGDTHTIFDKNGYSGPGYTLALESAALRAEFFPAGNAGIKSTSATPQGQWAHVSGIYDRAQGRVFFDGAPEGGAAHSTDSTDTSTSFRIGSRSTGQYYFDGLVDDAVIARRAFRDEEVKSLYLRGLNGVRAIPFVAAQEAGGPVMTVDGAAIIGFGVPQQVETTSAARTVTIWNITDQTLANLSVFLGQADAASFVLNTTSTATSLAPGASTTFEIAFNPQAAGTRVATVSVSSSTPIAANSFEFIVGGIGQADVPVITSLSSHNAKPGESVTITGSGFSAVPGNNAVWFGAAKGTVTAASTTQLFVTVPTGATARLVTVSVHGLTAFSRRVFTPSYTGPGFSVAGMEFYESGRFAVGSAPIGSSIADVDGDGKPDLMAANGTGNSVSVLRSTVNGIGATPAFAGKVDLAAPGTPEGVVAVDITGDGKLDMLVSGESSGELHVFRNDSSPGSLTSGSFTALAPATGGTYPQRPISCDLDQDGLPDLITAMAQGSSVGIHRQTAPGEFSARQLVSTDSSDARRIVAADFNSDGKTDLAVSHASGALVLLRNTSTPGVIQFTKDPDLTVSASCFALGAADLDGDGQDDLIAGMYSSSFVRVWRNTSGGSTLAFGTPIDLAVEGGVFSVAVGDLNGDGKPDIAAAHGSSTAKVSLIPNTHVSGALSSGSFGTRTFLSTGGTPQHVSIGDMNGDHLPELVVTMLGTNELAVWRSGYVPSPGVTALSSTTAKPGQSITITGTNFSTTPANNIVWFGSVRGTVTAATGTELTVTVPHGALVDQVSVQVGGRTGRSAQAFRPQFQGQGDLSTGSFSAVRALSGPGSPMKAVVTDIDGDGRPDVVVPQFGPTVKVFLNAVTPGSLGASADFPVNALAGTDGSVSFTVNSSTLRVAVGDLDGDGKPDLVTTHNAIAKVSVLRNTSTPGTASFATMFDLSLSAAAQGVTLADINMDGRLDIVAALVDSGAVAILRNQHASGTLGQASFATSVDYAMSGSGACREVVAADFTGDGRPDILASRFSGSVSVRENLVQPYSPLDAGSFGSAVTITTGSGSDSLATAELDNDGHMDCVVSNYVADTLSVLRNAGSGALASRLSKVADKAANDEGGAGIAVGDLNGDGKADVAMSTGGTSAFQVFQNSSTPPPSPSASLENGVTLNTGYYTYGANIVDMDADGRPDLVGASYDSSVVLLVRNIHAFGTPQIVVEQPVSTPLADGSGLVSLGNIAVGSSSSALTVTIRNTGSADLENLALSLSGAQMAEFSLGVLPTTILAPGASTTFTVTFSPAGLGSRSAALQIASNAAGAANPFDLTLTGSGINGTLTTNFTTGGQVGLTTNGFTATGSTVNLTLGHAPAPFSTLTLVNNTSANPITGAFTNLAQGQTVTLNFGGTDYRFFVDYFGGDGNDLVLVLEGPGVLDYEFGGSGKVTSAIGSAQDHAKCVAVQPDGKIVVAGHSHNGINLDFMVARYLPEGILDTTFNGTGKVVTQVDAGDDEANSVVVQPDGKIVAAGYSRGSNNDFAVVRYNSNGTLDTSFNGSGKVTTAVTASDDTAYRVVLQADGKVLVAGEGYAAAKPDFAIVRYNTDGSLDTSFDSDGKLLTDFGSNQEDRATGIALQTDGRIVVSGYRNDNNSTLVFALARYSAAGVLDTSFDVDGKVTTTVGTNNDVATDVKIQADGKIVAGGYSATLPGNTPSKFALVRYNTDGSLDTSFNGTGKVTTIMGTDNDGAHDLALQADGRMLLMGSSWNGSTKSFALARYLNNGSLDTSFKGGGKVVMTLGSGDYRMALQSDGKVIAAGWTSNMGNDDVHVARFLSDTEHLATFAAASDVPLNANGFTATGQTVNITLGFAPSVGTELRLMNNTGTSPITGNFTNLAHGATVPLTYNAITYNFIANYTGGTGNDLTLLLPGPGALDYSFNGSGRVVTAVGNENDKANSVAVQKDGRILLAGTSEAGGTGDFAVVRYTQAGALDSSFGTNGRVVTPIGNNNYYDSANTVAVQMDGKVLVGGHGQISLNNPDFALVRYTSSGSLDPSFGAGTGKVTSAIGSSLDYAYSVAVQQDGRILLAGAADSTLWNTALARFTSAGALDTSFGGGSGKVSTSLATSHDHARAVLQQPDGKIVVAGYAYIGGNYDFILSRYLADGSLDTGFGSSGLVTTSVSNGHDYCYAAALQRDGKILVAGQKSNGLFDVVVVRYNADGTLDSSFGSGAGMVSTDFSGGNDSGFAIAVQADGKIVVGGSSSGEFAVLRYNANGTPDTSFHGSGKAMIWMGDGDDAANSLAILPDGKIVLGGQSFNGSNYDFALVRLAGDTELNAVFDVATNVPLNFDGLDATGRTLNVTLNFTPNPGTSLKVFDNTGLQPISGEFTNLAHGQGILLSHSGTDYAFVANYFGGDGNDLTLDWANTKLAAFGGNESGQLGITGTAAQANVPAQVVATAAIYQKTILSMSAGQAHSLVVCSDGKVAAWGSNANGQLGNGTTTSAATPVAVTMGGVLSSKKVIAVAAGGQHSLALCSDGTLAAWGDGSFGQIGDNGVLDRTSPVLVSTTGALSGKRVIAISAGATHSAALCSDGTVYCWGGNADGQLGNSSNAQSNVPVAVTTSGVLLGHTVTAIACGQNHTLALRADGTLASWGSNSNQQLGNLSGVSSNVPIAVITTTALLGKKVASISAGGNQNLVLCTDGSLAAWGEDDHGQIGTVVTFPDFGTPQPVVQNGTLAGKTVVKVGFGAKHAFVVCSDGSMAAWGWNSYGQLGVGNTTDRIQPVAVVNSILGANDAFISAASGAQANHTLALIATAVNEPMIVVEHEGAALVDNAASGPSYGGLLIGSTRTKTFILRNTGTQTLSGLAASLIGTGTAHYAIDSQPAASLVPGEATSVVVSFNPVSFGAKEVVLRIASNLSGSLNPFETKLGGTGDPELYATWVTGNEIPAQAAGFDASGNEIILSLGFAPEAGTTLMVLNNTSLAFIDGFFDSSEFGQFAHGQEIELEYNGVFYTFVVNYFGGDGNDIVLQWAGTRMLAWGANTNGSLGNGSSTNSSLPVVVNMSGVLNGKRIIAASSALRHSLALCSDGTLAAWGNNGSGQLGNAGTTTAHSSVPVLVNMSGVLLGKTPVAIAAGNDFSAVLCSDGTVATWGLNADGQLGNNSTTNSNVPVLVDTTGVLNGKIITAIAAGSAHVLVRCSDGTLYAWGSNSNGQLGNNSTTSSSVPLAVTMSGVLSGKQVTRLAAGYFHSLVACSDGTLAAWGDNAYGMIGNSTSTASLVPVQTDPGAILGGRLTAQQGAGQFHSVWLGADGTLAAWGRNNSAQLGVSTTTLFSLSPLIVSQSGALAGKTAAFLANGRQHQVVLLTDGTLAAWGLGGSGQLGNGFTSNSVTPVAVSAAGLLAGERVMRVYSGTGSAHNISLVAQPVTLPGGPPVVSTNPATSVDKTTATLNGLVSPNSLATDARFEYGLDTSYGTQTAVQSLGSGSASVSVTQNLTGLQPNTTYHYRITATNSGGTANGNDLTFTTLVDPPVAVNGAASGITNTGATLNGSVNPNTRATSVFFRVSTDPAFVSNTFTTAPQNISAGSSFVGVSAPLSGLLFGTTYHYRLVAQNPAGEAEDMAAQSFTTTSVGIATQAPTISSTTALNLTTTSARLQGSVNAHGGLTNVFFEYGPAPGFGTNSINYSAGSGTSPQTMTHDITGLLPATQYQFRLVAENNFNNSTTTTGATITFTTLPLPPMATTQAAAALSTTSARLHGTVNAQNGSAVVTFEWGTNGTDFPNSLTATPSPVTGSTDTPVSVDLTNLAQFTTYHFRVKAVSAGGTTTGGVLTFQPAIISGLQQEPPGAPPASNGSLTVTLAPTGILSGWRFVGEYRWRASGDTATGLVHGSRLIEFRPVPGYLQPGTDTVNVTASGQVADYEYYATPSAGTGGVLVVLKPDTLAQAVNVEERGQWRLLGETTWRDSATTASSLPAGSYPIECKAVSGYATPLLVNVIVSSGSTVNPTIVYGDVSSPTGAAPSVLSFNTVSTDATKPYRYVGQIRSNSGVGTGFAVKSRVVATAAHVVFDEGSLTSVQGLQWLLQEDAGGHEPLPVTPRGYYLIDGYASQRGMESRGSFSLASRQLDAAALYFLNDAAAARTGFAGFLASDLTNNEFLISSAQKMLVGYPVDGIATLDQGRMHATPAANLTFTGLTDRVFATTGIRSTGGNSGGPLCVQHTNGNWYPSAIYLGGATQSIVRAIDSTVIQLFNTAQQSGIDDQGYTGGGITHSGYSSAGGTSGKGAAIINITPAGSGWRPLGSSKSFTPSGNTRADLTPGTMYVEFVPVNGYLTPVNQTILVVANSTEGFSVSFQPSQTPQETWRQTHFGTTSNSGNAADTFDFDGDGFTNAQEYAAGTNPTLSGDFFKAENPQRSGNTFSVSATGKAGRIYVLERSTTMAAGSWSTVDTEGLLSADGPVTLSDAASPPGAAFYRIRVTGP